MTFHQQNMCWSHIVRSLVMAFSFVMLVAVSAIVTKPKLPNNYESLPASEKENILWKIMKSNEGTQSQYPNIVGQVGLLNESLEPSVKHFGDDRPYNHKKRVHSVGAVVTTQFVITNTDTNPFTGIFQTGSKYGLSRLGLALPEDDNIFVPGIGVKFLRSNSMPSVNFFGMISVEGQQGGNFFLNEFSNHLPQLSAGASIKLRLLARKFRQVSNDPSKIGLSDIAKHYENGTAIQPENSVNFPYRVVFVPNPTLTTSFRAVTNAKQLKQAFTTKVPSNTTLYTIYGIQSPTNGTRILIGDLIATSKPIYSKWGDEFLSFRHQKIEDDMKLRPGWKKNNDRRLSEQSHGSTNSKNVRSRKLQHLLDTMTNNSNLMSMHSNVSVADNMFVSLCAFAHRL